VVIEKLLEELKEEEELDDIDEELLLDEEELLETLLLELLRGAMLIAVKPLSQFHHVFVNSSSPFPLSHTLLVSGSRNT
jgi:hypothetical protein